MIKKVQVVAAQKQRKMALNVKKTKANVAGLYGKGQGVPNFIYSLAT